MSVDLQLVAKLREITGLGISDCKKALDETKGDLDKAQEYLRRQGIQKADKKLDRIAKEGMIVSYIHSNGKIGVLVKISCETDFVARNTEFQDFAKDIAMQVAASNPLYVSKADVPAEVLEREKSIYRDQLAVEGKKGDFVEKIIEGKLAKFYQDNCLLEQPFVKDDEIIVGNLLKEKITKIGEKIEILQFVRLHM